MYSNNLKNLGKSDKFLDTYKIKLFYNVQRVECNQTHSMKLVSKSGSDSRTKENYRRISLMKINVKIVNEIHF
jgi:hypothetical protein